MIYLPQRSNCYRLLLIIAAFRLMAFDTSIATAQESSTPTVDIGTQKQLLVDDFAIAQKDSVTRKLGVVEKVGAVMQASLPTDYDLTRRNPDGTRAAIGFGYRSTVLWNDRDQIFQMWYRGGKEQTTAYAHSTDGIHWEKPLVTNGNSNLLMEHGEFSAMIDPTVAWGAPDKYKAAYNGGQTRALIAHSADGIEWHAYNQGKPVTGRAADTHNQIIWDPIGGRYLLLTRTDLGATGGRTEDRGTRIMAHSSASDLASSPTQWETLVEAFTVADPQNRKTPTGVAEFQMEAMTVWPYENVYFGLMNVLHVGELTGGSNSNVVPDFETRHESDVIDFYIGTSRDGVNFGREWVHSQQAFVPRGESGSFDKDMIQAASQIITIDDEHWIYYAGFNERHHSSAANGQIGLAKLPLDRFVSLEASQSAGTITTKLFQLEGRALSVNVEAPEGEFFVEVLDANGQAIPGYSVNDAIRYEGVDQLRLMPQWKDHANLSALKNQPIQLRFHLRNARIFAFQIVAEVPEPNSLVLAIVAASGLYRTTRRRRDPKS